MSTPIHRRTFLGTGLAASLGLIPGLRPLRAAAVRVDPGMVRLRPEIEPLVRLLETTPRERLLEEVGARIRAGLSYQHVLAALMLAGVRNIKPRPVGFKFHAVLVVHSAHQAAMASSDADRWLPLFWSLDRFKASQEDDVREGDWKLGPVEEARLPAPSKARRALEEALERWDEPAADAAAAQMARSAGAGETFEVLWRFGARDFRNIGHKAIYTAGAWRTLSVIGWEHAEPILRSLVYALLDRSGFDPARGAEPSVDPWRANLERVARARKDWMDGRGKGDAAGEILTALRQGSVEECSQRALELIEGGAPVSALWEGALSAAGELLMRQPGIVGLHCVTSANALHYAGTAAADPASRLLMLFQAVAWLALFRAEMVRRGPGLSPALLDSLKEGSSSKEGPLPTVEEVFAEVSRDRTSAARKAVRYLEGGGSPEDLMAAARRLVFLKGNDSHDYKLSSALFEDVQHLHPERRSLFLASGLFALRGSGERTLPLMERTRAALHPPRAF